MTAGVEKIFHSDQRIGFLAQAKVLNDEAPALEEAVSVARKTGHPRNLEIAGRALHTNRVLHFNNILDAAVAAVFLALVASIVLLSVREWILLLARRKLAVLHESEPVWLPYYARAETKPLHLASLLALAFALAKELSGEAHLERAQQSAKLRECGDQGRSRSAANNDCQAHGTNAQIYLVETEQRFKGVRRCC